MTWKGQLTGRVTFGDASLPVTLSGTDTLAGTITGTDLLALTAIAASLGFELPDVVNDLLPTVPDVQFAVDARGLFLGGKGTQIEAALARTSDVGVLVGQADVAIGLARLPVMGTYLDPANDIEITGARLVAASRPLTNSSVEAINDCIGRGDPEHAFPRVPSDATGNALLVVDLQVAGQKHDPIVVTLGTPQAATGTALSSGGAAPTTKWIPIQRSFGPVTVSRVGIALVDKQVRLLLDAGFLLGGFELDLDGLGLGFTISKSPTFAPMLSGIDVVMPPNGAVQISGGLTKSVSTSGHDEYDGELRVTAASMQLTILGSYSTVPGAPSLFAFGVYDSPLGGPPAFYVKALAAGFGVNRDLVLPAAPADVPKFPLLAAVVGDDRPIRPGDTVEQAVAALHDSIPPKLGENWLALGVRFTTFELVQTAALAAVKFGDEVEIDVIGVSTIVMPPRDPHPIGYAEIGFRASYKPADGVLAIDGQLTPASYLFTKDCHLTGGFAVRAWFRDMPGGGPRSGEFLVTLGGYHPAFPVPAGYPLVPRIAVNWRVSDNINVRGSLYFALTPGLVMAGGALEATFQSGSLRAWFSTSADFLLAWNPFHYAAHIGISLGASYTVDLWITSFTVTVHVGVDLRLAGPPFGGVATVDLSVVSFSISLGDVHDGKPDPISWPTFLESFLPPAQSGLPGAPADAAYCGVGISSGLVKTAPGANGGSAVVVVNPERFEITTWSRVPSKTATVAVGGGTAQHQTGDWQNVPIGVGPVGIAPGVHLTSEHRVSVVRRGLDLAVAFAVKPVTTNVAAAMWGAPTDMDPASARTVPGTALTGLVLTPVASVSDSTAAIPLHLLQEGGPEKSLSWAHAAVPAPRTQDDALGQLTGSLTDPKVAKGRDDLVGRLARAGLPIDRTINVTALQRDAADVLLGPPVIAGLGGAVGT